MTQKTSSSFTICHVFALEINYFPVWLSVRALPARLPKRNKRKVASGSRVTLPVNFACKPGLSFNPLAGVMHQSISAVPIPPGNRGAFAHVVSPGVGHSLFYRGPRGLGISIPRGEPRAFDTRAFERQIVYREGRGLCQKLACPSGTRKTCRFFKGMFS